MADDIVIIKIPELTVRTKTQVGQHSWLIVETAEGTFKTESSTFLIAIINTLVSTSETAGLSANMGRVLKGLFDWGNEIDGFIFDYDANWTLVNTVLDISVTIPAGRLQETDNSDVVDLSGTSGTVVEDGGIVLTKVSPSAYSYSFLTKSELAAIVDGTEGVYIIAKNLNGTLYTRNASLSIFITESPAINYVDYIAQNPIPPAKDYRVFADEVRKTLSYYRDGKSFPDWIGANHFMPFINKTGSQIDKGTPLSISNLDATTGLPTVETTLASDKTLSILFIGVSQEDVDIDGISKAARFEFIFDFDTSIFTTPAVDQPLWVDAISGMLTNVEPEAPDYILLAGTISEVGVNGILSIEVNNLTDSDTAVNIDGTLNGLCTQTPDVAFSVSGGIIYADVTNEAFPTKNVPFVLGGDRYLLDTTTVPVTSSAQIAVPPGASDILKQKSYLHIILNGSTPELAISTSEPAVPHSMICEVTVFNATRTLADGKVFAYRRQNNASNSEAEGIAGSYGFTRVLADDARSHGSAWRSGQTGTETVNDTTIKLALTAGRGKQLHIANTPLFDGNLYQIYNDDTNVIIYEDETNLFNIVDDSNGDTLLGNGFYYVLRLYYKLNSNGIGNDVIVTRPSGHYSSGALAVSDALGYTTNLVDTDIEDIVYPLYNIVIAKTGGGGATTTLFELIDKRSKIPGVAGGGGGGEPAGTDDKIRISAADTTNDYLNPKISSSDNSITKAIVNPGGNEVLDLVLADIIPGIKNFTGKVGFGNVGTEPTYVNDISDSDFQLVRLHRDIKTNGSGFFLDFAFDDSADAKKTYARINPGITTNTAGAEYGFMNYQIMINGLMTTVMRLSGDGIMSLLTTPPTDTTNNDVLTWNSTSKAIEKRSNAYTALSAGAAVAFNLFTGLNKTLAVAEDSTITFTNMQSGMQGDIRLNVTVISDIILAGSGVTFSGVGNLLQLPTGIYHIAYTVISATQIDYNINTTPYA